MVSREVAEAVLARYRDLVPEFEGFVESLLSRPLRCVRVNTVKADPGEVAEELVSSGFELRRVPWLGYAFYTSAEGLGKHLLHALGYYYVEDVASLIPPLLLLEELGRQPYVIDMAAAPGGKCTHIAQILHGKPYLVVANDVDRRRLDALESNIDRLGLCNVAVTAYDARRFPRIGGCDRIMLDAPCSSEALLYEMSDEDARVLLRRPYSRYRRVQEAMVRRAYELLEPGGLLVYCVCTVAPEEAEAVVDYAVRLGFKVRDAKVPLRHERGIEEWRVDGETLRFDPSVRRTARIYPHLNLEEYGGSVGCLYVAVLERGG